MTYEIKIKQFSGPLEKLLELIETRKLEITALNLAEVTADFLNYLKTIQGQADSRILADFVVVAAKLILIKSKALLPSLELTKEEEAEIYDLEARLKIYNEFKAASRYLKELLSRGWRSYSRPLLMSLGDQKFFYPPANLNLSDLSAAVNNLAATLRELVPEQQKVKSAIVTIEQKIQELLRRFQSAASQSFSEISKSRPKTEIVVLFLAILHLLKDRLIKAEQGQQFSDIILKKSHG